MWTYQHNNFQLYQIPALRDNFIYIIKDLNSAATLVVDPADASAVAAFCKKEGLAPSHILNTHHHWDHTDGNKQLVQQFDCEVIGNRADAERIPAITTPVAADSMLALGSITIQVIDVPGHTLGHIAFLIGDALFCGDTLFGAGCGRLFEGTYAQMWQSLQKIAALDDDTYIYCAHEYTLPNLQFALAVDENNDSVAQRIKREKEKRKNKLPTIPSTLALEKATNPFLWPLAPSFCQQYDPQQSALEIFRDIRQRKDQW